MNPNAEQPSFPEDVAPRDFGRRDVVGVVSFRGWGPHRGPVVLAADLLDEWGRLVAPAGTYRSYDYEQLWYRARRWFAKRAGGECPQ